jgi:prolyl oligopeptidase
MPRRTLARFSYGVLLVLAGTLRADEPDDPYRWLEDVTGEQALGWVRQRNAESTAELAGSEAFRTVEARILAALDSDAKIPFIQKIGPLYYNFWKDAKHRRGIWRRTTLEEYRKPEPDWETVLDLDALNADEHENWVWHGAEVLKPDEKRCLIALSRGGADADVVREFDLTTRSFIASGYALPEAKSHVSWRGVDSIYVGTDFGPGSLTKSGYPRVVKEWTRGTPLAEALTVYEAQPDDISARGYRDLTPGFERDFIERQVTFWTDELFFRKGDRLIKIDKPDDAVAVVHREWLFLRLRSEWNVGDRTFPAGALLATDFDAFLSGQRRFDVLFEPTERKSLAAFSPTLNRVLVNELDNVRNRLFVLTPKDGRWERAPLPGAPELGTASVGAVDDDESDDYFLTASGYLTPSTYALGTAGGGPPEMLKQAPAFFDATGLAVSQHEAVSRDGTRIPYFQVARQDLALDGTNPTLLHGYGGFEIPLVPAYSPSVGIGWLEKGGVYVIANIRGGGEFGPRWHQAALKANRPLAYEDFQAVAEDLIRRKVTAAAHLGIQGGSNGGLLVGNMLTRTPELFGAVVCQVPLLDMRRYHTLLAGASWMSEYGNPDLPAEWAFIKTFSPYHRLEEGVNYPRTLFMTSTRDDRVHPGHARKMAAKMKAMNRDILYYENIEGGHGGAADNKQLAFMQALAYTFLWKQLK